MTTTDSNGIVFLEETDPISPFHTLINSLQTATSAAFQSAKKGFPYAANTTERQALLEKYGSSATSPLWVDMNGAVWRHNGSSWALFHQVGVGAAVTADSTGGGNLSTAWAPSTSPAQLNLAAGKYIVHASMYFNLSLASNVNIQAHLFDSSGVAFGAGQDASEYRWPASQGGTSSFGLEFTRLITVGSSGQTVQIRRRTSATGGTQASGTEHLTAVRVS